MSGKRTLDADLIPKGFRVPCAGCGRKMHPAKLVPVLHHPSGEWYWDKRCLRCVGETPTTRPR